MGRTKALLVWILCVNCLFRDTLAQTYPSPNQDKTIRRLQSLVSNWITVTQYRLACNLVSQAAINGLTYSTAKTNITNALMGSLSSTQLSTLLSKGTSLLFVLNFDITGSLAKLTTVLNNNFMPVYNQLVQYAGVLRAQGLQPQGIAKNGHRIMNSFITRKRVKTIFTRVGLKFTASQWRSIATSLNGILQFSKHGIP